MFIKIAVILLSLLVVYSEANVPISHRLIPLGPRWNLYTKFLKDLEKKDNRASQNNDKGSDDNSDDSRLVDDCRGGGSQCPDSFNEHDTEKSENEKEKKSKTETKKFKGNIVEILRPFLENANPFPPIIFTYVSDDKF